MSRNSGGWIKLHRRHVLGLIGERGNDTLGLWSKIQGFASRREVNVYRRGALAMFPVGTLVTSLRELAGTDQQRVISKVRRDLAFFESIGEIKQEISREGRVISLLNWETDQISYSEKSAQNEPEIRHTNDTPKSSQQGMSTYEATYQNDYGKVIQFPIRRKVEQMDSTHVRHYIGEGEVNTNTEELKGEKSPSALCSPSMKMECSNQLQETENFQREQPKENQLEFLTTSQTNQTQTPAPIIQRKRIQVPAKVNKKCQVNPAHEARFIATYVRSFQQKYKCRPDLRGKVVGQIRKFLREVPVDYACQLIQTFLQMDQSWFGTKCHDFATFDQNLNVVMVALANGSSSGNVINWEEVKAYATKRYDV